MIKFEQYIGILRGENDLMYISSRNILGIDRIQLRE